MTDLLLDTSAVSAAMAGDEAIDTYLGTVDAGADIFTSVIVEGEVRFGLARLAEGRRKDDLTEAFEDVFSTLRDVLQATREVADEYGRLKAELWDSGTPIGENDLWIAATARAQGLVILTSDPDFKAVSNLQVAGWFDSSKS